MKFKNLFVLAFLALGAFLLTSAHAQSAPPVSPAAGTVLFNGIQLPAIIGTPITVNGQTLLITTNASGGYTVQTSGPNGTNSFAVPQNITGVEAFVQNAVNHNNPANIGFYSTNGEWDLSIGGAFAQNSGQAAAQLSIERYGVIPQWPNVSLGAAVLEGNANGQNGTAGAYAFTDYRRPIGDVAFIGGIGAGYDNYNKSFMGVARAEVEYRQNRHLGEYVGVGYAFEGSKTDRGLILGGGIRYAF